MNCPTCGASVVFAQFRRPVYGDPRKSSDPSKPEPLHYVSDAECANGHELVLRDGNRLLDREEHGK
jgi:hypothetical protein